MSTTPIGANRGRYLPPGYSSEEGDLVMAKREKIAQLVKATFKNVAEVESEIAALFPEFSSGKYPHFREDLLSTILETNHLDARK